LAPKCAPNLFVKIFKLSQILNCQNLHRDFKFLTFKYASTAKCYPHFLVGVGSPPRAGEREGEREEKQKERKKKKERVPSKIFFASAPCL
jgi:hypothetical protein